MGDIVKGVDFKRKRYRDGSYVEKRRFTPTVSPGNRKVLQLFVIALLCALALLWAAIMALALTHVHASLPLTLSWMFQAALYVFAGYGVLMALWTYLISREACDETVKGSLRKVRGEESPPPKIS